MYRRLFPLMTAVVLLTAPTVRPVPIPPNAPVSGHQTGLQNEEQVFICPDDTSVVFTNHRDFRLGYRQIGLGRSTNGGATWTDSLLSTAYQIFDWQSDPIMTVTSSGAYVIGHLDFSSTTPNFDSSLIVFLKSENCGVTWSVGVVESNIGNFFEDKQFVTSDLTGGPYDGNVYVSWTRFSGGEPVRIMFCASPNGGLTWGDTLIVGAPFFSPCFGIVDPGQLSQPLVGKDGAVYVFWGGVDINESICDYSEAIRVNKSLDGGATWQGERVIGRVDGWNYTASGINIYSQPTTAADLSNGPHAGNLYLQYRDTISPYGSEIMFRRSLDTGNTWSSPTRVPDVNSGPTVASEQFHNWLVCNEEGILVSTWYDSRTDPPGGDALFDVFAAYSFDGGETWTSNHRVSSVSISTGLLLSAQTAAPQPAWTTAQRSASVRSPMSPQSPMAGLIAEYIGVSCVHDKVVAVWTDTRDGDQDVYSARWYLFLTDPRLIYPLNGETIDPGGPELFWATAWKEGVDSYDLEIDTDPAFGSPDAFTTTDNLFNDPLAGYLPDTYYWRIRAHSPDAVTAWSAPGSFNIAPPPCQCDCHADPGGCDGVQTVLDVVQAVNVAFRNAATIPDPNASCPYNTTDVNCDNFTTVVDVVKMVNVAFRNASAAVEFCDPCP